MSERKRPRAKRNGVFATEIAELKARASIVQRAANAKVQVRTTVHRDIYRKAVEIAEQTGRPLSQVIQVAIVDGLLRWTDFSTQQHEDALRRLRLSTAQEYPLRDPLPDGRTSVWHDTDAYDASLNADPELLESQRVAQIAADLAGGFVPLPSVGTPVPLHPDELELPPAAQADRLSDNLAGPAPDVRVHTETP